MLVPVVIALNWDYKEGQKEGRKEGRMEGRFNIKSKSNLFALDSIYAYQQVLIYKRGGKN